MRVLILVSSVHECALLLILSNGRTNEGETYFSELARAIASYVHVVV